MEETETKNPAPKVEKSSAIVGSRKKKKKELRVYQPEELAEVSNTELRMIVEDRAGVFLSPWTPREELLKSVLDHQYVPKNPMDEVRIHQIGVIADKIESLKAQIPAPLPGGGICDGNCFEHTDMQVAECQYSTKMFRHPNYPK